MKANNVLAIFLFCNSCRFAAMDLNTDPHSQVPSFTWLDGEAGSDVAILEITFPDGGTDKAILNRTNPIGSAENIGDEVDEKDEVDCNDRIFSGFLATESVSVFLKGCPGSNTFNITLDSSPWMSNIFSVVDGVVTADMPPNSGSNIVVDVASRSFREGSRSLLIDERQLERQARQYPLAVMVNIVVRYDNEWKAKFGQNSVNKVRRLLNVSQEVLEWPTLKTKILLNVSAISHIDMSIELIEGTYNFYYVCRHSENATLEADAYIYLSVFKDDVNSTDNIGKSFLNKMCDPDKFYRTAVVEYVNDKATSETFAHEVGHMIGMKHDYERVNGVDQKRDDDANGRCLHKEGVMSPFTLLNASKIHKWTECSNRDFRNYYDSFHHNKSFCLKTVPTYCGNMCQFIKAICYLPVLQSACILLRKQYQMMYN